MTTNPKRGETKIYRPEGRIDANCATSFAQYLNEAIRKGTRTLILDFSTTEYLSSVGLRVLRDINVNLEDLGGKMILCGASKSLMDLFKVVHLDQLIPIYTTKAEALASLEE